MNLVDQTIALFSPKAALRREVARQKLTAFSRFDAAKITRQRPQARQNMPAEQIGGTIERIRLMNRARDLDDNFSTIRAILTHFIVHVAGSLSYQARTGNAELDREVEAYLEKWFYGCDITGRHSLLSLTQLVLRAVLVDGDCGVVLVREGQELKLQTVTADRIGRDIDLDQNQVDYVGGITMDSIGRPVSYRVYQRDRSGRYLGFEDVGAENFCHIFVPTRLDEYRGRSVLAACLDDAQDVMDLIEYEKLAARWASSQAAVIKTEYGADEEMASVLRGDRDQFGNEMKLTALEPGRINYLGTGESMDVFKNSDRPAQAFSNFVKYLEDRMCRALGVSARVTLDRTSAGPEARKDLRQAERTFDFWRYQMEHQFLNKVVRLALMDAAGKGLLPNRPEVIQGQWQWAGSVSIDAGRDARADIELWRTGLATAAELYGEAGHDWQTSIRQRAKEAAYIKEMAEEMGVTVSEISSGVESVATDPNAAPITATASNDNADAEQQIAEGTMAPETVQDTALNGAQVQALLELAQSVAGGILSVEAAKALAAAAFPLVPEEIINRIFDNIEPNSLTPDEIRSAAADANLSESQFAIPAKYAHINFKPTAAMAVEAKRGLEWRQEHNRGGTAVGVARARDLSNRTNLSVETVKRMHSYFARHEVDKQGQGFKPDGKEYPSAGRIAWALWGGDAGQSWAAARVAQMDAVDDEEG
jgi:capsid protein